MIMLCVLRGRGYYAVCGTRAVVIMLSVVRGQWLLCCVWYDGSGYYVVCGTRVVVIMLCVVRRSNSADFGVRNFYFGIIFN